VIEVEIDEPIATLRLAHGKVNALDLELLDALSGGLDQISSSPARAVVLTGSGRSFSAGVDLQRVVSEGRPYLERFLPALDRALEKLYTFPLPVVAAANGHAIAGGCILVQACDRRLMAAGEARIGIPELRVGVPFPPLPLEIMRSAVAPHVAQWLMTSGQTVTPDIALQYGLLDEVVEPAHLMSHARHIAFHLSETPPATFRLTKKMLRGAALERVRIMTAEHGDEIRKIWADPETITFIRGYLERTIGGGRKSKP